MGDDEEYDIEDDGMAEFNGVNGSPFEGRKNNKWLVVSAVLELLQNICESFSVFFGGLKTGSLQRYCWQQERQDFFEEASKSLEKLSTVEMTEVKDASSE